MHKDTTTEKEAKSSISKAEQGLYILYALIFLATTILWAIKGSTAYNGNIYYISDTNLPEIQNITLSQIDETTYRANYYGFLPAGTVNVYPREREVVSLGDNCLLATGDTTQVTISGFVTINSIAERAGLCIGDVVLEFNDTPITSVEQLQELQKYSQGQVKYLIQREDATKVIYLEPDNDRKVGIYIEDNAYAFGTISFAKDGYLYAYGHDTEGVNLEGNPTYLATGIYTDDLFYSETLLSDVQGSLINSNIYGAISTCPEDWATGTDIEVAWSWEIEEGTAYVKTFDKMGNVIYQPVSIKCLDTIGTGYENYCNTVQYRWELYSDDINFLRGMSGSPVIQNNRLIGILTAVSLDNSHVGYMLSAQTAVDYMQEILRKGL